MTIHILVEGPSERAFLDRWAPRLLRDEHIRVHPHQGKGKLPTNLDSVPDSKHRGLLDQLPAKLRGFANSLNPVSDGVLILVDADDEVPANCLSAIQAVVTHCASQINSRVSIAIEETEAFYLGDLRALRAAYPDADMQLAEAYVPDSICGTWELFDDIIKDGGGNKVAWAEMMGPKVTIVPAQSRSPSFKALISNLRALTAAAKTASTKKAPRRPQKRPRAPHTGKR